MTHPAKRRQAIASLLAHYEVEDQEALVELLFEKHQISSNQTTVSRDLKELGVIKKIHHGKRIYAMPTQELQNQILELAVLNVTRNETLIVIATGAGLASFVGDQLDQADLPILGCISGENVVFIAPESVQAIESTFKKIKKFLRFQ